MKRRVLCIFSLLAYLLLFCTVFAPMAQREMTLLADVKQIKANSKHNTNLPGYSAQWEDEEGVFQVVEGTGWDVGNRVDALPQQYYSIANDFYGNPAHITLHPGTEYSVILSASRTPQVGDLVTGVTMADSRGEKLILYTPAGISTTSVLQNNFTVLQQGEKGILLDTISIKMPFFEHRMVQSLDDRVMADGLRIYSYTDAESFLWQLPLLALIFSLLMAAVILWGGTCALTKKQKPKWLMWINAGVIGLTLLLLLPVTNGVDLPASLMPSDNFLNIGHYYSEFSNIFTVMESVGDQSLRNIGLWMTAASAAIILIVAALSAVLLWLENKWSCRKAQQ